MARMTVALVLALMMSQAQAVNWVFVGNFDEPLGNADIFFDIDSTSTMGAFTRTLSLSNYAKPVATDIPGKGTVFIKSTVSQYYFNCRDKEIAKASENWFSETNAKGDILFQHVDAKAPFTAVRAESAGGIWFKGLCATLAPPSRWTLIEEGKNAGTAVYVDLATIAPKSKYLQVWTLTNQARPVSLANGATFLSQRGLFYVSCTEREIGVGDSYTYSKPNAEGDLVTSGAVPLEQVVFRPIPPDSPGERMLVFACGYWAKQAPLKSPAPKKNLQM